MTMGSGMLADVRSTKSDVCEIITAGLWLRANVRPPPLARLARVAGVVTVEEVMANEPGSGVSPPICSCDCGGRHAEAHVAELESDIENLKAIQRHCDDIHAAWQEANTRVTTLTAQVSALTKANHNIIRLARILT